MDIRQRSLDFLITHTIPYTAHEHPPAYTIEDCLLVSTIDWDTTVVAKNVFLCNRQQTRFYLMMLRPERAFRTAMVSKALGVSRLSFAPEPWLERLLGLKAGAVSPLGLLFDEERQVTLALDEGLRDIPCIAIHPCVNTATVVLNMQDFTGRLLPAMERCPLWINPQDGKANIT